MIKYDLIRTEEELTKMLVQLQEDYTEYLVIDTETSWEESNAKKYVLGISVYAPALEWGWYIAVNHVDAALGKLAALLEKLLRKSKLVFHNAKFDIQMLLKCGIRVMLPCES